MTQEQYQAMLQAQQEQYGLEQDYGEEMMDQ